MLNVDNLTHIKSCEGVMMMMIKCHIFVLQRKKKQNIQVYMMRME